MYVHKLVGTHAVYVHKLVGTHVYVHVYVHKLVGTHACAHWQAQLLAAVGFLLFSNPPPPADQPLPTMKKVLKVQTPVPAAAQGDAEGDEDE